MTTARPASTTRGSTSQTETEDLGAALGAALRVGDLVVLSGDLGAGKTCLVRGMARGIGDASSVVRSPTFVFHHVYSGGALTLHHIDCYRLGTGADLGFLDLDDLLADAVVAIEWGEYANLDDLPAAVVTIDIGAGDDRTFHLETSRADIAVAWGSGS